MRAAVVTTLALAACGTMLPESAENPPTTTGGDAAVVTETGAPADVDGASSDGAATDAAIDGPDAGCTRAVDDPFTQLATPPWTLTVENGGVAEHAANGGANGTGALHAAVAAGPSSTTAQVSREVTGPLPKSVRLAFGMRVASANTGYAELGCTLQLQGGDPQTFISFQPEIAGGNLAIDSSKKLSGSSVSTGSAEPVGALDPNHWYSVDIQLADITVAGGHVVVLVDGVNRYDRDATFPSFPSVIRVKCGIDFGSAGAAASVFVDDVVLDQCR